MNFADCLLSAAKAGELDEDRAKLAIAEWKHVAERHEAGGMSKIDARQLAGDELVDRMRHAVTKQRHVTARQLHVLQRNQARYADAPPQRLVEDIEHVEREGRAIFKQAMGGLQEFLRDHAENIVGQVRGRAQLSDIMRELHGADSGNVAAKQMAAAINAQREWLRTSFNSLGGDIRKLDDYGVAHSHNRGKITAAGFDSWFDDIYGRLDWNRIVNFQTNKPFAVAKGAKPLRADAETFLRPIYQDIATRGWADRTPGFGTGSRALFNSGQEHRVLHFKSADDWLAYNEAYGTENAFQAIVGEFQRRAMDIARMRAFGPNPKAGVENAIQVLEKAAHLAPRNPKPGGRIRQGLGFGRQPEDALAGTAERARVMHGLLSGEMSQPADHAMAGLLAGGRGLLTAAQLGSATLSMITDLPSQALAAKAIGQSPFKPLVNTFNNIFRGIDQQTARELGFILESWADASVTSARYMGDVWQPEITGRISNFVLKANGMTAINDRERVAIAMAFGSDLAGVANRSWDELDPNLREFMRTRQITAEDWDKLRDPAVIYTDRVGGKHLNPSWFREHSTLPPAEADDMAIRFGALIEGQIEMALPTSSLRGQAILRGRAKAGSFSGELIRSTLMYKSFALSQLFNQIRRVREMQGGTGVKAWYVASYMTSMTVAGALAVQLKEIAKGRDPQPMDRQTFWAKATLQGGGLGIFGDFFQSTTSRAGGGLAETLAGPVFGAVSDVGRAVGSNVAALAEGKDSHVGRDVVNLARRYNPAATLLPTRLALDRVVWDQLQELLDPDAASDWSRAERKMKREQGSQSWWRRGDILPSRTPDLSNMIGDTP